MYKFLLPVVAAAAFMLPAQQAEAGSYGHRHYRHRHYSRPVVVYRDDCYRPYRSYYSYHRPVRYYRSYDYCYTPRRVVHVSRPRFAFSFGF